MFCGQCQVLYSARHYNAFIRLPTTYITDNQRLDDGKMMEIQAKPSKSSHGNRPVGGGYPLELFHQEISRCNLEILEEHDLTELVAPSIELERQLFRFLGITIGRSDEALKSSYPVGRWMVARLSTLLIGNKRLAALGRRLEGHHRTIDEFCKHNRYLMLKMARSR